MKQYEFNNANEAYQTILSELQFSGKESQSRNLKYKQFFDVSILLKNPRNRIITDEFRNLKLRICIAEFLWYMTRNNKVSVIEPYIKKWKEFSDDGIHINSNYGSIWHQQVLNIIEKIKKDKHTRQAVVSVYDGKIYSNYVGKDTPCTLSLHFQVYNDRLNLTVNMRSQDLIYGFTIDQFVFSLLQEIIANELELHLGEYVHIANNIHIYKEHYDLEIGKHNYQFHLPTYIQYSKFWQQIDTANYEIDFIPNCITRGKIDLQHFKNNII